MFRWSCLLCLLASTVAALIITSADAACPLARGQCFASKTCQWSDELAKCVSSLPCALELTEDACVANTWQCSWNTTTEKCSTSLKRPATADVSTCATATSKGDCAKDKTCMWNAGSCKRRPTIVLSLPDDLGWYDVSWRNPRVRTPVLERLRTYGFDLDRFYMARFCAPSRAMVMTGRYPWRLGLQTDLNMNPSSSMRCGVDLSLKLLPQHLKELGGYSTHAIGKWHLGTASDAHLPTSRGFDTYIGWLGGGLDRNMKPFMFAGARCACAGPGAAFCNPYSVFSKLTCATASDAINVTSAGTFNPVSDARINEDHSDLFVANRARDLILSAKDKDPLFLFLSWATPHTPVIAPRRYYLSRLRSTPTIGRDASLNRRCPVSRRLAQLGMVGLLDESHRIVIEALDRVSRFDSTIFIFASDNGGNTPRRVINRKKSRGILPPITCNGGSNYPLRGGKFTWWEGGIRVTAFIASVDHIHSSRRGATYPGLISGNDLVATLIAAAGNESVAGVDKDSVNHWPALSGEDSSQITTRSELPLQVWLETNRHVVLFYSNNTLYKIIQGYPWSGTGCGNIGDGEINFSLSDIMQPWELPRAERKYTVQELLSPRFHCSPHCLFDVQNDIQELDDLSLRNSTVLPIARNLVEKYAQEGVLVNDSNLCAPGFYAQDKLDATDRLSIVIARRCGAFIPWLYANNTIKPQGVCI